MKETAKQTRRLGQWQNDKRFLLVATVALLVLLSAFVLAVVRFGWDWTGFNERFGPELGPEADKVNFSCTFNNCKLG